MGFDGAATFSGDKTGVQRRLKKNSPHALFVHCHCHPLQLACVQAANHTTRIKEVYTTLTTLWKFFHYFPKRAECLKEVKRVKILLDHYGADKPAETVLGVEICTLALTSCELHTEWKTFRHFLAKKNKGRYEDS